jgi:hypothetical protein
MYWKRTILVPLQFLTFSRDDKATRPEILISYTSIWSTICLSPFHSYLSTPLSLSLIPSPFPWSPSPWSLNASRPQFCDLGFWWLMSMCYDYLCFPIVIILELVAPHHCSPRMRGRKLNGNPTTYITTWSFQPNYKMHVVKCLQRVFSKWRRHKTEIEGLDLQYNIWHGWSLCVS